MAEERRFRYVGPDCKELGFPDAASIRSAVSARKLSEDGIVYDRVSKRWQFSGTLVVELKEQESSREQSHETVDLEPVSVAPKASPEPPKPEPLLHRAEPQHAGVTQAEPQPGSQLPQFVKVIVATVSGLLLVLLFTMAIRGNRAGGPPSRWVFQLNGLVTNYSDGAGTAPARSANLSLRIYAKGGPPDSILIGAPLSGTGKASVHSWADSVLLITTSQEGDTIVWVGSRNSNGLTGTFFVTGGVHSAQGGRWLLRSSAKDLKAFFPATAGRMDERARVRTVAALSRYLSKFANRPIDDRP